ncbi:MAG: protease pro-enzyme activation domain-containing protein, partial [Candidatus Binataceae bacterium]
MAGQRLPSFYVLLVLAALIACGTVMIAPASGGPAQDTVLITQKIDESNLVTLAGNTRPEANAQNDRGPVASDFPLNHLWLQLRRPPGKERALSQRLNELTDPKSPNYHHWLTAREFGQEYGLARADLATITGWLQSHGFTINGVNPNGVLIDFSGTAGRVNEAFHTEIHRLSANGAQHFANMSDPQIPAALAPAIVGIVSLNNFMPQPQYRQRAQYTVGLDQLIAPADLATIYNLNPLFAAGYSGQGQAIVVLEDSDVPDAADWSTFRSAFDLRSDFPDGSFTQIHPAAGAGGACDDPGSNGDDF